MSVTTSMQPPVHERDRSSRFLSDWFYFSMSLLILVIVVYGFAQRADMQLMHPLHPKPLVMWIHAVVFLAWVLFYISQSALVRAHNVRLHRTMGWFGVALGATLPILGTITLVVMRRFDLQYSDLRMTAPDVTLGLMDLASFTVPFVLAIYWRAKPERHRRLMLVATCTLTAAPFVRFPPFFHPWPWYHLGVDLLIALAMLRDLVVQRRIHAVYLWSLPLLFVAQVWAINSVVHFWGDSKPVHLPTVR